MNFTKMKPQLFILFLFFGSTQTFADPCPNLGHKWVQFHCQATRGIDYVVIITQNHHSSLPQISEFSIFDSGVPNLELSEQDMSCVDQEFVATINTKQGSVLSNRIFPRNGRDQEDWLFSLDPEPSLPVQVTYQLHNLAGILTRTTHWSNLAVSEERCTLAFTSDSVLRPNAISAASSSSYLSPSLLDITYTPYTSDTSSHLSSILDTNAPWIGNLPTSPSLHEESKTEMDRSDSDRESNSKTSSGSESEENESGIENESESSSSSTGSMRRTQRKIKHRQLDRERRQKMAEQLLQFREILQLGSKHTMIGVLTLASDRIRELKLEINELESVAIASKIWANSQCPRFRMGSNVFVCTSGKTGQFELVINQIPSLLDPMSKPTLQISTPNHPESFLPTSINLNENSNFCINGELITSDQIIYRYFKNDLMIEMQSNGHKNRLTCQPNYPQIALSPMEPRIGRGNRFFSKSERRATNHRIADCTSRQQKKLILSRFKQEISELIKTELDVTRSAVLYLQQLESEATLLRSQLGASLVQQPGVKLEYSQPE